MICSSAGSLGKRWNIRSCVSGALAGYPAESVLMGAAKQRCGGRMEDQGECLTLSFIFPFRWQNTDNGHLFMAPFVLSNIFWQPLSFF